MDKNNRCWMCGELLTEDNCRPNAKSYTGKSYMCVSCESDMFDNLAKIEGKYIALYHICVALDIPVKPIVLDGIDFDNEEQPFLTYINLLEEKKMNVKKGKLLGFKDGITDLRGVFGKSLSHTDFAACIENEKKKIQKDNKDLCGTEEQRERWGVLPIYKGLQMTAEIYDELDRQLFNRMESLKGITITPQIENTLIIVAKNSVIYDFLIRQGLVKQALDMQKSIDLALSSEQLRKKDEKPLSNFRPDAWIDSFEKAGLMGDGQFLTLAEIEDAMIKIMRGKGYEQTLDAAHQLELNIINNANKNVDKPTVFELSKKMKISDELGEFAQVESDEEKEIKNWAKLSTVRFEGDN